MSSNTVFKSVKNPNFIKTILKPLKNGGERRDSQVTKETARKLEDSYLDFIISVTESRND